MRAFHYLCHIFSKRIKAPRNLRNLSSICTFNDSEKQMCYRGNFQTSQYSTSEVYENDENETFLMNEQFEKYQYVRNLLFKDTSDTIMLKLDNSASVEDVMNIINQYGNIFTPEHLTRTILVLTDLQTGFYFYNGFCKKSAKEFFERLQALEGFQKLLRIISTNVDAFSVDLLSDLFLFINKLGFPTEHTLMQEIALKLRNNLRNDFHLGICAKLLSVIFNEKSIRPYNISLDLLPKIISTIDKCSSLSDIRDLTICLNNLQRILTYEVVAKYVKRVDHFLNTQLQGKDYKIILDIVLFLNYPQWRNQNSALISRCLLLIKDDLDSLSISELITAYEVFYRNQEPGEMLNNLQRCSAKFLQLSQEKEICDIDTTLKLFSSFIYFSAPTHRTKFRDEVVKYVDKCQDLDTWLLLKKLISYVKVSDEKLCEYYWNIALNILEESNSLRDVVRLSQSYISFNTDVSNFRHLKFEKEIFRRIEKVLDSEELIFSTGITVFLSFCLKYHAKHPLTQRLIEKTENNLSHMDSAHFHQLVVVLEGMLQSSIPQNTLLRIERLLNNMKINLIQSENQTLWRHLILTKAMILRGDVDSDLFENVIYKFKELDFMSSKFIESLSNIFLTSGSIVPEVLNKCTEYIISHSDNIVGFNAEKMLYICYHLAYYPLNDEIFFKTVTDIIFRDMERLSGLSILQTALALSFFNKLPPSLIKQIFSTEFMDRLDVELEHCYSKDRYPQRVRSVLIQLNRAVCLENPEFNVPWFHQKYVEGLKKRSLQEPRNISLRIAEYLSRIVDKHMISENIITPYGYHLNFVLSFDENGEMVPLYSADAKKRLALLLMKPHSYTRFYKHFKGRYQHKNRHLEILGYEVRHIDQNQWTNLLYADERLDFLCNLIDNKVKKNVKNEVKE